jgi:ubiquinol-cytochrome c reductase iron-sulfur subunit
MSEADRKKDEVTRRDFVVLTANSMAAVGACCALWPMVDSLNPASNVVALSSVEDQFFL